MARTLGLSTVAVVGVLAAGSAVSAQTQPGPDRTIGRELPASIADLRLETPEATTAATADLLRPGIGSQDGQVVIRLSAESGATAFANGRSETVAKSTVRSQQDAFIARVRSIDSSARVIARTQLVLNAVFIEVSFSKLADIATDSAVVSINPVGDYELDLSETVPYIGAKAVQDAKTTGKGIKVAVLDSGIDYTHTALGGAGAAAYAANNPTVIEPGTFPTAKVKGGYDFVGAWPATPGGATVPDPDPLDDGALNPANQGVGHGTHVADIIGGKKGVAPGVDLYGVKVCSTSTTSCSGIALIQGMEWTLDPDGDGNLKDRMHIINMSLGASYGQPFDDDLSLAVENATRVGILTVASAGNSSDKPYATGTPSSTDSALSVAQTAVPSAFLPLMQILQPTRSDVPAVFQPWSKPLSGVVEGPVQYGDGKGGNLDGCVSFAPGSLVGKVVLVDRGNCGFSQKISNVADGTGLVGIIGLIAPGDPFEGGVSTGDPSRIPGFMITLANANRIRGGNAVVRFDPSVGVPLKGSIVGSSSRGPQHESTQRIKPEVGAPGASISAVAGSGTGTEPFGGTSGAAPMVTGSAALVLEATGGTKTTPQGTSRGNAVGHGLSPLEVKSLLMNNAETNIVSNPLTGALTEITRIGGGEVRVDRAVKAPIAAWVDGQASAALGFGFVDVDGTATMTKTVRISNLANKKATYSITPTFRFANDTMAPVDAVTVSAPATVDVKPGRGRDTTFDVTIRIDGSKLRGNFMNSGSQGANPAALTTNEYDGYVKLTSGTHTVNIPWHVLPRKAAKVAPSSPTISGGGFPEVVGLNNQGVGTAQLDAYALVATSPNLPEGPAGDQSPTPDIRSVGINTFIEPGCEAGFVWAFSINSWERQEHLLPVSYWIYLDTTPDRAGYDYAVINRDATLVDITDGRQFTWSVALNGPDAGLADAFFTSEHSMNTGNTALYICGEQVGLTSDDILATNVGMAVEATDFYYGGPGDLVEDIVVTPLGEQFLGIPTGSLPFGDIPGNTNDPTGLAVYDFGPFPGNTDELGVVLVTNGDRGTGNRGGATQGTEALLLLKT